jgi:LisH domain-containing protein ARMC9
VQLNQQHNKAELDKNHILLLLDKGQREEFFKQTSKLFHNPDEASKKLEFELNVYFCIYNIHPCLKKQPTIDKANAEAFKKYLDTKGADLSETSEFLSFFALPFMPRPQDHKALAHVFTKEWISKLKGRLTE